MKQRGHSGSAATAGTAADLNLRHLRAFLLTAQTGSASATARKLKVSQPAVSQTIQELEKLLRVKLFERLGGRMLPTLAGRALISPTAAVFSALDMVEPAIASFRGSDSAYVRVGTGATVCIHLLPDIIAHAKRKAGGLQVLVVTGNVDELVAGVEDGTLDVALVTTERLRPSAALSVEQLFSEDFIGIVPQRWSSKVPPKLDASDFTRFPLLLFEPAGRTREIMDAWFASRGVQPVPSMELGSVEAIKKMVAAGLGISFVPSLALRDNEKGLALRPLEPPLQRHLCLVLRGDKVLDAGLRTFLSVLRAEVQTMNETSISPRKSRR